MNSNAACFIIGHLDKHYLDIYRKESTGDKAAAMNRPYDWEKLPNSLVVRPIPMIP
jgi:putative IMPACT (imprinted ancient) family translation regulator